MSTTEPTQGTWAVVGRRPVKTGSGDELPLTIIESRVSCGRFTFTVSSGINGVF